jgi:hypothetical protein
MKDSCKGDENPRADKTPSLSATGATLEAPEPPILGGAVKKTPLAKKPPGPVAAEDSSGSNLA